MILSVDMHHEIAMTACIYANYEASAMLESRFDVNVTNSVNISEADHGQFRFIIEPGALQLIPAEQRTEALAALRPILRRALRQSLIDHQGQFVGMILGYGRKGKNYFNYGDSIT